MSKKLSIYILALLFSTMTLLGASCLSNSKTISEGGVYKSIDNGSKWQQVVYVGQTEKQIVTIADLTIKQLEFLSTDGNSVLAAGGVSGLYLTNNAGQNWQKIGNLTADLVTANVNNQNLIYVASGNKIYKTEDQGKNWTQIYVDTTPKNTITLIRVDAVNPSLVYAGTSSGTALMSLDAGASWQQLNFFKIGLVGFAKQASGALYFADSRGHLWRSDDSGKIWTDVVEALKTKLRTGIGQIHSIAKIPGEADGIIMSTQYGLHKSSDGGKTWETYELLTSPRSVTIKNLLINPVNAKRMWYIADQSLYRTDDGGVTWETLQLPSKRSPSTLLIDQKGLNLFIGFNR